ARARRAPPKAKLGRALFIAPPRSPAEPRDARSTTIVQPCDESLTRSFRTCRRASAIENRLETGACRRGGGSPTPGPNTNERLRGKRDRLHGAKRERRTPCRTIDRLAVSTLSVQRKFRPYAFPMIPVNAACSAVKAGP